MINLHYSNGKIFVWNEEDIYILRKEHRIVGSLVGCYPIKPFQIQSKWLPLQLLPEEARLLVGKGIAQLVSIPDYVEDSSLLHSFHAKRDKLCEEQIILLKEHRRKEILEKADVIYEGKKRKLLEALEKKKSQKTSHTPNNAEEEKQSPATMIEENNSNSIVEYPETIQKDTSDVDMTKSDSDCKPRSPADDADLGIDKEAIIETELAKIPEVGKELCMVQLFTENPWKSRIPVENWKYPFTQAEKLRCRVFRDLWEKGYYITTGTKFGGDFLAYEGDPLKYHALFIVVCMNASQKFQGFDLVVYGRLGHQVKKTVALASLNEDGEVDYISLNWENEML